MDPHTVCAPKNEICQISITTEDFPPLTNVISLCRQASLHIAFTAFSVQIMSWYCAFVALFHGFFFPDLLSTCSSRMLTALLRFVKCFWRPLHRPSLLEF